VSFSSIKSNRILITGGSGFIGTNLVDFYLDRGFEVLSLDISPPQKSEHKKIWKYQDVCEYEKLLETVLEFMPERIFHMAARTDLDGRTIEDYAANTIGVKSMVNAANQISGSLKKIIFASSMLVFPLGQAGTVHRKYAPNTTYGESKAIGEEIVWDNAKSELCWEIVRPTSIWGPWFSTPYKNFFEKVLSGFYFHPKKIKVKRNYGFVLNTIHQLNALSQNNKINRRFIYLGDYDDLEILNWAQIICRNAKKRDPVEVPIIYLRVAAVIGDFAKALLGIKNPPLTSLRLKNLTTESVIYMGKLKDEVGPLPYSLDEGVRLTLQWLQESNINKIGK